jgi:hypothetical protein
MLNWFIKRKLAAFTAEFGYDTSYARELLDIDRSALFAFARVTAMGDYRKDIPKDVYWAAKLLSMVAEDCGPCTQLCVTLALKDGVAPKVLAAALAGDEAVLTADQKLGIAFMRASRDHDLAADDLRDEIIAKWGKRAVVSLAFAIAVTKIYPTVKYALGYGKACSRVTVGDQVIVPRGKAVEVGAIALQS